MVKIYKNLLSEKARQEILTVAKLFPDEYWTQSICTDETVKQLRQFLPRKVMETMFYLHKSMIPTIEKDFKLNENGISLRDPDYYDITNGGVLTIDKREPGMSLSPHADRPTGTYEKHFGTVDGYTPITMSCVYYWNDDFEGGEINFYENANWQKMIIDHTTEDLTITQVYKPVAGDFIVFPSDLVHGIAEVKSGDRYSTQYFYNKID